MVIKPKARGFICTTAHPEGCFKNVDEQIEYVKSRGSIPGAKKVLVIGASTGFGLATRIVSAFGCGSDTVGVFFERPAGGNRTASAGWYNAGGFEERAKVEGLYSKSINGDAFSMEIKEKTIKTIKDDLGQVDLVVYSLAAPRRVDSLTGNVYNSVIKPIGKTYTNKTVDFHTGEVTDISIEPATNEEIEATIKVMGGEDYKMWITLLKEAGVLAEGVVALSYSYIGPEITHAVYRDGTIGRAKDHLEETTKEINELLKDLGGRAYVSVNKALVTQSSSAIPVVPLYISLLYNVMKEKGIHEGCIEQMYRLYSSLYTDSQIFDKEGRIRIDNLEMREDVQEEVKGLWERVSSANIDEISDIIGYRQEFFKLFGFGIEGIDYDKDTEADRDILNMV